MLGRAHALLLAGSEVSVRVSEDTQRNARRGEKEVPFLSEFLRLSGQNKKANRHFLLAPSVMPP